MRANIKLKIKLVLIILWAIEGTVGMNEGTVEGQKVIGNVNTNSHNLE